MSRKQETTRFSPAERRVLKKVHGLLQIARSLEKAAVQTQLVAIGLSDVVVAAAARRVR